jgi:phosphodiesterase/alkaline phosphatase D-like protein
MRARKARVAAIYDDHDFLGNNRYGGDHDPALREAARAAFVSAFAPVQTGSEVYSFQPLGLVDLVVLDARFHRRNPADSAQGREAVLGPAQWEWLESVLKQASAPYLLLASSTTLHTFGDESWEQYPAAFSRLVQLLAPRRGALAMTGDVHRNASYDDSGVIEIVSSAVARRGLIFGAERRNWAQLDFSPSALHVTLHALKLSGRQDFVVPLSNWRLP